MGAKAQVRLNKMRENVSQRVQDWNTAVDKFSTRGGGRATTQPVARKPMRPGGVSGAKAVPSKGFKPTRKIVGPYK